jgi:hypothetical protein
MLDNYKVDECGVIHQQNFNTITYDADYIKNSYYKYPKSLSMGYLRLGYLIGSIGHIPTSILDVGYGSGDFLKVCKEIIPECYGYDITTLPPPEGTKQVTSLTDKHYDVVTFFDVLEHFKDIYEICNIKCNYICISLPWCHYYSDEWFTNWKHRRPNEHLHHFNDKSLISFFKKIGFNYLNFTEIEDTIRKGENKNILTAVFKKQ